MDLNEAVISKIRELVPISSNLNDHHKLLPYIKQAININVIHVIKYNLFTELKSAFESDTMTDRQRIAMVGGGDEANNFYTNGLITAIAYFALGHFIKEANGNITAYGIKQKVGDFSMLADYREVVSRSNDVYNSGQLCLNSVMTFLDINNRDNNLASPQTVFLIS